MSDSLSELLAAVKRLEVYANATVGVGSTSLTQSLQDNTLQLPNKNYRSQYPAEFDGVLQYDPLASIPKGERFVNGNWLGTPLKRFGPTYPANFNVAAPVEIKSVTPLNLPLGDYARDFLGTRNNGKYRIPMKAANVDNIIKSVPFDSKEEIFLGTYDIVSERIDIPLGTSNFPVHIPVGTDRGNDVDRSRMLDLSDKMGFPFQDKGFEQVTTDVQYNTDQTSTLPVSNKQELIAVAPKPMDYSNTKITDIANADILYKGLDLRFRESGTTDAVWLSAIDLSTNMSEAEKNQIIADAFLEWSASYLASNAGVSESIPKIVNKSFSSIFEIVPNDTLWHVDMTKNTDTRGIKAGRGYFDLSIDDYLCPTWVQFKDILELMVRDPVVVRRYYRGGKDPDVLLKLKNHDTVRYISVSEYNSIAIQTVYV